VETENMTRMKHIHSLFNDAVQASDVEQLGNPFMIDEHDEMSKYIKSIRLDRKRKIMKYLSQRDGNALTFMV
jgi:hypothetical protein